MECHELRVGVQSDDGTLTEDSNTRGWYQNEEKAWNKIGLTVNVNGEQLKNWVE